MSLTSDSSSSVMDINNWDKPLYFNSYVLIKKKDDNSFDYSLKVEFSSDAMSLHINRYHLYNVENTLTSDNGRKPIKNKKNTLTNKSKGCILWGTYATDRETGAERLVNTWWECDGDSGGGNNEQVPPDGGGEGGQVETTQAIEDYIDDTELDACTKDILNKLKNLGNGDIAEMLKRFSNDGSIYATKMSTGEVEKKDPNVWAQTKINKETGIVTMVFNADYINGKDNANPPTDLSVATTMAHEIIHAYLLSILQENNTLGASVIYDFPTIYEAYVQYQITKDPSILPDEHHRLMSEKYVNAIASTIQEFHTGQQVTSGFPHQVYLDMAWGGLDKTKIFNENYPNDPNHKNYKDRERIMARINTEKLGSVYGINTPLGTPCKK
ncbi:hypothetical protein [Flavobacterium sp. FlaQc-28]|uniref:hypothetical protein n=1 Tax=Flavobacterium sp. FlaQc-28 TaxID=3374178 RepID=UPI0037576885